MHKALAITSLLWLFPALGMAQEETLAANDAQGDDTPFYQTLDTAPAPVLSPEEALGAFRVAPGFEVELVAAEPLVEDPVAMAWDAHGRLYVVEMRGYMPDVLGTGSDEPVGQVVRLRDLDGDGRMDTSEVFLGELVNPRAVAVTNAGILVGEPPNLWLCRLDSPDSLCETPERIGDYAPDLDEGNVEHLENGLLQGLDNWLYNAKSARSFRLRDGRLEVREGPHRGQWGIAQDNRGRLFYNHNSTWLQADLLSGEDLVVGTAESGYPGLGVNLTSPSEVFSVRVNPGVNRAYLEGTLRPDGRLHEATGVSGLAVYRGDQFPAAYLNDVFVPEVAANVVAHFRIREDGLELSAEHQLYDDPDWGQREFLGSTDERFRPVDASNGPDGSLYIIDMYRGIVQDAFYLTDELRDQILMRHLDKPLGKGRIWRVRHAAGSRERGFPVLAGYSDAALVEALSSPNGWERDTAQRLLLAREGDLDQALLKVALGDDALAASHALWTLAGRDELQREHVLAALRMGDTWRQVHALRAGGHLLSAADMLALSDHVAQGEERLQLQWALAQRHHSGQPANRRALRDLLLRADSVYLREAVARAVHGRELEFLNELVDAPAFAAPTPSREALLTTLAARAYRHLRGDLGSLEPAPAALTSLLDTLSRPAGERAWQQVAMLQGLYQVTRRSGFEPARLPQAPALFREDAASDALAEARLAGRRAFTWPGDPLAQGVEPLSPEQRALMQRGEQFYARCAACHGADGQGISGLAPALAGASWVTGRPEWLGRVILQGMSGPVTVKGEHFDGVMPAHAHLDVLDDALLAGLMTYLRRSWGNAASAVSTEQAADIRQASRDRQRPWTVAELEQVPYDRGFGDFVGEYSVAFITITITEREAGLHMEATMGGGGLLERIDDSLFAVVSEEAEVQVEFIRDAAGTVQSLIIHREGQEIPAQRR